MYALGIDCGTTYSAAAVWRDGRAQICTLGTHAAVVPSVVLARADGGTLVGEAAARRALVEPDRVAREFKRRLGDATPLMLGGEPFPAENLTAALLSALVSSVRDREGEAPSRITVTHPANWGSFKIDLLRRAVELAGLDVPVGLTTEPEAAAISYARQERLAPGETVAVFDLGGGTFDSAVLRRTDTGFVLLGQPEGIERLGGVDIDAAVFAHVVRAVGAPLTDLDEDDVSAVSSVARLRAECIAAKEALSTDTDTTIPVLLPGWTGEVRLTRAELEAIVRPSLYDSIEALKRALRSAGVVPDELAAVLLVGGSSRMPLIGQLVGAELGLPVAIDTHPKHAVALGAAWHASGTPLPLDTPAAGSSQLPPSSAPMGQGGSHGPVGSRGPVEPLPPLPPKPPLPVQLAPAEPVAPVPPHQPAQAYHPVQPYHPAQPFAPVQPAVPGVHILRPAQPGERPGPAPVVPANTQEEDEADRRRRAAILGGAVGAGAGIAGVVGYEQGVAAAEPQFEAQLVSSSTDLGPAARPPAAQPPAAPAPHAPHVSPARQQAFTAARGGARALTLRGPWAVGALSAMVVALVVLSGYAALRYRPHTEVVTSASAPSAPAGVRPSTTGPPSTSVAPTVDGVSRVDTSLTAPADVAPDRATSGGGQSRPATPSTPATHGSSSTSAATTAAVGLGYDQRHTGVVTSGDGKISCPDACKASYPIGTPVTLTASGEPVDHWTGCASASGATCQVTAGDGRAPTVTYVVRYRVGVGYSGRHTGTVTSDDGTIACPGTCAASYPKGTLVTLRANGEKVDHWSGCAASSGAVCQVTAGDGNAPSVTFAATSTTTRTTTTPPSSPPTTSPGRTTSTPTTSTPTTSTPSTPTTAPPTKSSAATSGSTPPRIIRTGTLGTLAPVTLVPAGPSTPPIG